MPQRHIVNTQTGNVAKGCELLLFAHDHVYLQQVPRKVPHIYLTSGNRAELLVRCINPGNYVLTAGRYPSAMGTWVNTDVNNLVQPVVLRLSVTARSRWDRTHRPWEASWPLQERKCAPLYPGYAAPLTDAKIIRANAVGKMVMQQAGFTRNAPGVVGNIPFSCSVNGRFLDVPDPNPLIMEQGKIIQWTNFTGLFLHPLHLHSGTMTIVALPLDQLQPNATWTAWYEPGDRGDTLQFPQAKRGPGAGITLRIQPGPFSGYSMMHCHFLQHEDAGCVKLVKWQCPGYESTLGSVAGVLAEKDQPMVCKNFQYAVPPTVW
ncbi:hypothetical protein COHA_010700 [Chlorella ohadii]|uniref:Plastocyanin-like domain-containing protein n=1 Tax=Chlorella ohadii TaxID=2649997 RepID=A0AAD5DCE1_9CHLO|nr:hypothetical protein COHA_010700 [Chlorella ohadii]